MLAEIGLKVGDWRCTIDSRSLCGGWPLAKNVHYFSLPSLILLLLLLLLLSFLLGFWDKGMDYDNLGGSIGLGWACKTGVASDGIRMKCEQHKTTEDDPLSIVGRHSTVCMETGAWACNGVQNSRD